jgi:steroid delta-isomerase-like uncharacterized protein
MATTADLEDFVRRWFHEVWNEKRADTIDEMVASDCRIHGLAPGGVVLIGPQGYKESYHVFSQAFPDVQIAVDGVLVTGDMIAARFTCRGTHRGDQLGMPATGRTVEFTGMTMARIRDGRYVEAWNVVDFQEMGRQLTVA